MDFSAFRSRKRMHLAGAALALLLCCMGASAQIYRAPPTIADAHAFLGDTFQRFSIEYAVWYGMGTRDNYRGRAGYYGGRECYSEVGIGAANRMFAVDWSLVSSVEMSGSEAIYVSGQLLRTSQNSGARYESNFHLYFPNARVAHGVSNALEFLRRSCQRQSKFD